MTSLEVLTCLLVRTHKKVKVRLFERTNLCIIALQLSLVIRLYCGHTNKEKSGRDMNSV